jgi:hypothetical protein
MEKKNGKEKRRKVNHRSASRPNTRKMCSLFTFLKNYF